MTLDSKAQLSASVVFELGTFWFRVHVLSHCATFSICEGGTSSCIWLICFTSFNFFLSDIKCRFHSSPCAQSLIHFWHITISFSLLSLFILHFLCNVSIYSGKTDGSGEFHYSRSLTVMLTVLLLCDYFYLMTLVVA